MPSYIPRLLERLHHIPLPKPQDSPYLAPNILYRAKVQLAIREDDAPKLELQGIKLI